MWWRITGTGNGVLILREGNLQHGRRHIHIPFHISGHTVSWGLLQRERKEDGGGASIPGAETTRGLHKYQNAMNECLCFVIGEGGKRGRE
jgi:hypothetical protein